MSILPIAICLLAQDSEKMPRDLRASEVVEWTARHSGRKFVHTADLGLQAKMVSISPGTLDPARAYEVGVGLLKRMDLAAVPLPDGSGTVHIEPAAIAGKRSLAVFDRAEALPKADEFCTLALRMKHISPRDAQAAILNVISFPQGCLSCETAGTLIVSDFASNLRKVAELVRQMDVPPPSGTFRVEIALLEGADGKEGSIPEPFREIDLPAPVKRKSFRLAAEAFVRIDTLYSAKGPGPEAAIRVPGFLAGLSGPSASAAGIAFEKVTLRMERTPPAVLLETRIDLKGGTWVAVGAAPGDKEGVTLVLVMRATRDR